MEEQLKIAKTLSGSVLGIGLPEILSEALSKNQKTTEVFLVEQYQRRKNETKEKRKKEKRFSLKKMRKAFGQDHFDHIIAEVTLIPQLRRWIPDSIYVGKKTLYLYGSSLLDWDKIKQRYHRYPVSITALLENDQQVLLKIELNGAVNHRFRELGYRFLDCFLDFLDFVTDLILR